MKKVLVSHETPFCLLEKSFEFCDYQYALAHLLESYEIYRNHFLRCKENGIDIYLDNSLHELGYAMNDEILLKWIDKLHPSNFFIPDVWQDASQSIINARKWSQIELPEEVTKVAVVQAKNFLEATICYQTYKDLGYKKIAFSYGAEYYTNHSYHPNKNIAKALGRVEVIGRMYDMGLITNTDKIHLLGTACPFEFSLYKNMDFIESLDTSNPVMATLDGIKYQDGFHPKPKANMNTHFNILIDSIDLDLLKHNVEKFRSFC